MISDDIDAHVKSFRIAAMKGNWMEVLIMYDNKRELRTEKIAPTGDTVLHMAASSGELYVLRRMVRTLKDGQKRINEQGEGLAAADENGDEKKRVLGAKNEKGNTPLHLAASASKRSFEMCKMLGKEDPSLITIRNINGETPLFMAALHGNKEAFLWLHYHSRDRGPSTYYRNHDNDTILHCAIAGGHIDLAIEIVHLYKDHLEEMAKKKNKNGLRPLHLLAATPSAFESTDLSGRSFLVQLLYHWFFRVKKKEQATAKEELKPHEREPFFATLMNRVVHMDMRICCKRICLPAICWPLAWLMWFLSLFLLASIVFALFVLEYLFLRAENWFHGIQKLKENHIWSLQIMKRLAFEEDVSENPHMEDRAGSDKIVDTPLMIAAQNGVIEMVEMFLSEFPSTVKVVNEEGKNIVLLAAEKRQTKLYHFLCEYKYLDDAAFRQVDKNGNTALHLAATFGVNLTMQTTTMIQEFKWFEFVKSSVPSELREKYNSDGKTAEEIFRESYKEHMTSDRNWLNQTSQTCSVASTVVASMAFSNFAGENIKKKNNSSLVALSLSLTSTICFLAILAFRSQSRNFWRFAPFMLHLAILTMIGSIVALWISLTFHGKSLTTSTILGSPIAILTIFSLPIFIGPTLKSMFAKVPPPNRSITSSIPHRKPQKKEDGTDFDRNQKPTPNHAYKANNSLEDNGSPRDRARNKRTHSF